jgi:hypothetical protein
MQQILDRIQVLWDVNTVLLGEYFPTFRKIVVCITFSVKQCSKIRSTFRVRKEDTSLGNRHVVVGVVTRLWAGERMPRGPTPVRSKTFVFPQKNTE